MNYSYVAGSATEFESLEGTVNPQGIAHAVLGNRLAARDKVIVVGNPGAKHTAVDCFRNELPAWFTGFLGDG